jgi:hypothetical protein
MINGEVDYMSFNAMEKDNPTACYSISSFSSISAGRRQTKIEPRWVLNAEGTAALVASKPGSK